MVQGTRGAELSEGDGFAGYRIVQRLGRGGMGVVYLAIEERLERRVALKLITPEAAAEKVFRERFAHESRIAASIEHPNVVPIYAAGEEGDIPYIAMRYVSGSDLGRRVGRGAGLDPEHAVALIAQVANGLDAIHAAGLVHRDVKPANVLLSGPERSEHAYLTDFGVARNVASTSGLTQTGRFVGTLDYVAPEQISGAAVDARADVYALGCLLHKLLTGEVPFPKDGEAARLYAHLHDPPPAPSLSAPSVPMALDDVVIRAMSKGPDDRYPSAGDLGRAAVAAVSGRQVSVPERTVATGAAATRTPATVPSAQTPAEELPAAPTGPSPPAPAQPSRAAMSRRRFLVLAACAAALAAVVGAIALGGSSGGGDSTAGGAGQQGAGAPQPDAAKRPALAPAQLVARGDAVCTRSQDAFRAAKAKFPPDVAGESVADVRYSRILAGISRRAVAGFASLVPPPSLRQSYERYVRAQKRVQAYDVQALKAARRGDTPAYLAARQIRNSEQPERHDLARRIGFEVCSAAPTSG